MAEFKPLPFDGVMLLSEFQLEQIFPHGASLHTKKNKPDRFSPCPKGISPALTLSDLLKERSRRVEPIYYLRQSYSVPKGFPNRPEAPSEPGGNYTTDPSQAMGVDKDGRGTPEIAVSPGVLERYAKEAERFKKAERSLSERVGDLEGQVRPQQLASLKKRVEALERVAKNKAA